MVDNLRRTLSHTDLDAHSNVVVWDHGPKDKPHEHPVPMKMSFGDAGHALKADARYALEPALDNAEVEEEMARIKNSRIEAARVAALRAAADQLAADHKTALATIVIRRKG
jgi:hypothetical protein